MFFSKTLPNGIRVVGQHLLHFQSVGVGIWIGTGSAKETDKQAGISHFIEHMLFKGTEKRTAKQIAVEMDAIGANMNAFTAKEYTCYYARSTKDQIYHAMEILADMVQHSQFRDDEMENEKRVVLEEILMTEDTPEDLVLEELSEVYYENHPLAHQILGYKETLLSFTADDLRAYMKQHYVTGNIVIAVAGNFDENQFIEQVERLFRDVPMGETKKFADPPSALAKRIALRHKDVEQMQICLASPGFSLRDERYYALTLLANALGGSMSSRLFQKIREEKGLAYSVSVFPEAHINTGSLCYYAGCTGHHAEQVISLILEEMRDIKKNGMNQEEILHNRQQLVSNYILSNESVNSRMMSLGRNFILFGDARTPDEVIQKIQQIDARHIEEITSTVFDERVLCGAFVGRLDSDKQKKMLQNLW